MLRRIGKSLRRRSRIWVPVVVLTLISGVVYHAKFMVIHPNSHDVMVTKYKKTCDQMVINQIGLNHHVTLTMKEYMQLREDLETCNRNNS